jgi:hypothetical protein
MNDSFSTNANARPEWFTDFEEKLVDLIRSAPGAQTQDLGACLTVLIPKGGGADNAVFGGLVTSREEHPDTMRMELLTAVVWALIADGISPEALRVTFDHSVGILDEHSQHDPPAPELDADEGGPVN